jgi:6-pyruvoyltetrahydropterin/6-carboxytetrahydropterin synthase
MRVTKEITFDAAHRLLGYNGPCSNLHGHTYRVRCTWDGPVVSNGMVRDFARCKVDMQQIMACFDHRTILQSQDPLVPILREQGVSIYIMENAPTAENMAMLIKDEIVNCEEVTLWETPTSFVTI